jgi:FkbM family methyltransferase
MHWYTFVKPIRKSWDKLFQRKSAKAIGKDVQWFLDPKQVSSQSIVLSGGVGQDISFELELASKVKQIYLFDPSPTAKRTLKNLKLPKNIEFFPLGLSKKSGKVGFAKPDLEMEGSFKPGSDVEFGCISISDFCKEHKIKHIDLLKIDIEGFEYGVLEDLLKNNILPDQICVEFHHFMKGYSRFQTAKILFKLYKKGYRFVYKDMANYSLARKKLLRTNKKR